MRAGTEQARRERRRACSLSGAGDDPGHPFASRRRWSRSSRSRCRSIRLFPVPAGIELAATGPAADQAARQAHVRDFQQVITEYQATARAAHQGNPTVFRSDFDRVAPRGYPARPDQAALDHARPRRPTTHSYLHTETPVLDASRTAAIMDRHTP